MAEKAPIKRGGKYCVAGTRDNISCTNTSVCNISLSTQFFLLDNTQLINYLIQRQYFILRLQKGVSHDQYRRPT